MGQVVAWPNPTIRGAVMRPAGLLRSNGTGPEQLARPTTLQLSADSLARFRLVHYFVTTWQATWGLQHDLGSCRNHSLGYYVNRRTWAQSGQAD
jgi:hypothetical protein